MKDLGIGEAAALVFSTSLILVMAWCLLLVGCSGQNQQPAGIGTDNLSRIRSTRIIEAGYISWPPTVYMDEKTQKVEGHMADTLEEIARQINAKVDWIPTTWNDFTLGLATHKFDVVFAGTYVTGSKTCELCAH